MNSRSPKQDQQNDEMITDIRLKIVKMEGQLSTLQSGVDTQGKKQDTILENITRFATENQLTALDAKSEKKYATKEELKAANERLEALYDDRKWLIRLIMGAIILGLIAAFITFGDKV